MKLGMLKISTWYWSQWNFLQHRWKKGKLTSFCRKILIYQRIQLVKYNIPASSPRSLSFWIYAQSFFTMRWVDSSSKYENLNWIRKLSVVSSKLWKAKETFHILYPLIMSLIKSKSNNLFSYFRKIIENRSWESRDFLIPATLCK